jgi:hypothetical protein
MREEEIPFHSAHLPLHRDSTGNSVEKWSKESLQNGAPNPFPQNGLCKWRDGRLILYSRLAC